MTIHDVRERKGTLKRRVAQLSTPLISHDSRECLQSSVDLEGNKCPLEGGRRMGVD